MIHAKEEVDWQMHQTLLIFKHNLKAVINGITLNYSNDCLEGCKRKIKLIERTAFGYANCHNLLTRIRLAENKVKKNRKKLITSTVMSFYLRRLRDSNSRTRITRSTPLARAPLQPLE